MNKIFKKTTALFSAAVMTVCGTMGSFPTVFAEEGKEVEVIFDFVLDKNKIEPDYRKDGELSSINDYGSFTATAGSVIAIPLGEFTSETHGFEGWTADGFYGYEGGETYRIPEDYAEDTIVFKAIWYDYAEKNFTDVKYVLEYDGVELERPEWLKDTKAIPGMLFEPNYTTIKIEDFGENKIDLTSSGLTDGERVYKFGTKFIMGTEPITLYPIWLKQIMVTFTTGDVDRINGNTSVIFPKMEEGRDELAASDRFSRNGFNLVGWISSYDGQQYKPGATVTFPGEDVTFTAVWEPKNYNVVFKTGNGGENKKVPGLTDTTIICPDPEHTVDGMTFAGWKDSEGEIYPVGSEYLIKGAIPGSGIVLTGVWTEGNEPPVTTEPVTTTTTEPATTTTSSVDTTTTTVSTTEPVVTTTTTAPTTPPESDVLLGDANRDGKVSIADAAAIFQNLANGDKYKLTEQGLKNADCCNPGSGITAADAIAIQKLDAGLIDALPFIEKE
ncbi:MAG: hypothetical protein IKJ60_01255 [Ruminococcus sp.]|nr:hypothetical protein [Ruminococcus sp.]